MTDSFIYKNDRPWPNPRLKRAAIVGHVTAETAKIWFRTAAPGEYEVLVYAASEDPADTLFNGFKAVPYEGMATLPDFVGRIPLSVPDYSRDSTIVADIVDLEPETEYRYALFGTEDGKQRILLGQDQPYRFRTLPAASATAAPLSFAFYSCHMPYATTLFGKTEVSGMAMWDCLNDVMERHYAQDFRFLLAGGDQVYVDGVTSLDIWKYLNGAMKREGDTLSPTQEEMTSWYRDIYRGYWGFPSVRKAFGRFPTYMIWDDHELADGWGSLLLAGGKDDELDERFPQRKEKGLSRADCLTLLDRMRQAALQVYEEYQHGHNPDTPAGQYDYAFDCGSTAVYVLDGRGQRDINRAEARILGKAQLKRFADWLDALDPATTKYLFVVAAVPLLHMKPVFANADDNVLADLANLQDDLRDSWEHALHDKERRQLLKLLFKAAARGIRVSILSGDVHISAVFRMTDEACGATIHQLTSSALTYNKPRFLGWVLGNTVPDAGTSDDGYRFERLALYTDCNFGLVTVDPRQDQVVFQLYGMQKVAHPDGTAQDRPVTHSIAKIELRF
jgi:alkaline phosphatase D